MDRRRTLAALTAAGALTATALIAGAPTTEAAGPPPAPADPADRVVIVLFDQMVPQYADQFDMPNFRKLRGSGTTFKNAYLGYMASETVMAHNVITSGLEPRHMGWTDEAYRDHANVFGKGVDAMHITGDLSLADFIAIEKNDGIAYPKLADYLHEARPGTEFITVGQKPYAVTTATGASGDIGVYMSGRKSPYNEQTNPAGCKNVYLPGTTTAGQYRQPDGHNVPDYLLTVDENDPNLCGRFYISSTSGTDYGTKAAFPSWLYPTDGNRYVPGTDPDHLGGDTWVADAAIAMMENEDWSGMFITMGAIDKNGHMWGAQDDNGTVDCTTPMGQTHVQCAAENADAQLGKIMAEVEKIDAADGGHTLVVLTADHGATYGEHFYGKTTSGAGNSNWYYAPPALGVWDAGSSATAPDYTTYSNPSPDIAALNADGNVQFSYQSTAIEAWLLDRSPQAMKDKADQMLDMPGVTASYYKNAAGDAFVLRGTNAMTKSEKQWWKAHGQEIVDTMAADDGPDIIGLLHDKTSYGVYGDHGGAQESVQRVPMVFWGAGVDKLKTGDSFRTPDVLPTILEAMGIDPTSPTDGVAHPLGN